MAKKGFLFVLLLVALVNSAWAFDFYAVCSTGQTLYYTITDAENRLVKAVPPNGETTNGWDGYTKPIGQLTIPAEVSSNGIAYIVDEIGKYAFSQCNITAINLPYTLRVINDNAFYDNELTFLSIPSSVRIIEDFAFTSNFSLTNIIFPDSLEKLSRYAFSATGWYNNQPNGLVYAGNFLMNYKGDMPSNTNIQVQEGTRGIANCSFYNCIDLNSISLPSSLLYIGEMAFNGCTGLSFVAFSDSVLYIGERSFYNCTNLANISLPNSILYIGEDSFSNCTSLTNITIPLSCLNIGKNAFYQCSNLASVTYNARNAVFDGVLNTPFQGCSTLSSIYFGNEVQSIPDFLFYNCSTIIGPLEFPSSLVSIGEYAFYQCSGLSGNLMLPNSLQSIGDRSFQECIGFTGDLIFPNSLQTIGTRAFYYCSGFSGSVVIPESLQLLGAEAFVHCQNITTVYYNAINCQVGSSSTGPFMSTSPSNLIIGSSVISIPAHLFSGCSCTIDNLVIPDSVVSIGSRAFFSVRCTSLTIGSSVSSVGASAFNTSPTMQNLIYNAVSCETDFHISSSQPCTLIIGDNVQIIPGFFMYDTDINSPFELPNSIVEIRDYAFHGIHVVNNRGLVLPSSLTTIGVHVFYGSGFGGELTIPQLVTYIGSWAFGGCTFNDIHALPENPPILCGGNFYGSANPTLEVPCGCYDVYRVAWGWTEAYLYEVPSCTHQISAIANPSGAGSITGVGVHNSNGYCQLEAMENSNYEFLNWTENGTVVSDSNPYIFRVVRDRTLVANFQYQQPSSFTITASASPSNGGTISGTGTYDQGATCTLSATPSYGYVFLRWTENGNQVSTNPTYSFTVNGNRTLVANFQYDPPTYTINASANPTNGGSVSGAGTFIEGQVCTLTASPNSSFVFLKWTENGTQVSTSPTYSFTVNSNRTLVAHFQSQPSQYTITLSANPNNGGSVSGGGTFNQGQTCNVTANANPNYSFENWTENGTQVSANSTYSFTVTGNRTLVANFSYSPTGYVINATAEPSYGGLVSGAGTYNQGRTCTLIATPNPNYDFVNWTEGGNVVSTSPTYSFTVNGNRTLVAHFESQVYTISVSANPSDGGTVYGCGDYSAGITCHLIAIPNNNYSFLNWTENGVAVSSESDYSFVVTGNRSLTANFVFYDGVNELEDAVSVYPNPTSNKVYIEGNRLRKIEVYNALGVLALSEELSDSHIEIDLQHLPAGIYCLRIYTEDGAFNRSVVKE